MKCQQISRYRPCLRTFQSLGEDNFKLLSHLLPDDGKQTVTYLIGSQSFTLHTVEKTTYTTLLSLSWQSLIAKQTDDSPVKNTDLLIRIYHDAKLAEVLSKNRGSLQGCYVYPNDELLQVDEKERLNLFLYDCLRSCVLLGKLRER